MLIPRCISTGSRASQVCCAVSIETRPASQYVTERGDNGPSSHWEGEGHRVGDVILRHNAMCRNKRRRHVNGSIILMMFKPVIKGGDVYVM